jgi:hypothetical protein
LPENTGVVNKRRDGAISVSKTEFWPKARLNRSKSTVWPLGRVFERNPLPSNVARMMFNAGGTLGMRPGEPYRGVRMDIGSA